MNAYLARKEAARSRVLDRYVILGFIASGTYGKVYKAKSKYLEVKSEYAIKKFKPERESQAVQYTGLSQSAIREMSLCREIRHENVVHLHEVILEDKCIYMVFDYAEHDLLQIIHYHLHQERGPKRKIPDMTVRSILAQLLAGVAYLHENWILHRDLKPANIMIDINGQVKIGDLGLARNFRRPLQSLYAGDKVVVTIWYRAPELLLGAKHYGPAIDLWAIGCIFAELLVLKPLFKGDELKMDPKTKQIPFQRQQMSKITDILGVPTPKTWDNIEHLPEYPQLKNFRSQGYTNNLPQWWRIIASQATASAHGLGLLMRLLEYDPTKRVTALEALKHPFFAEQPKHNPVSAFDGQGYVYPNRQIRSEDADMSAASHAASTLHAAGPGAHPTAGTHSNASSVAAMAAAVRQSSATTNPHRQSSAGSDTQGRANKSTVPSKRRNNDQLAQAVAKRMLR